VNDGNKVLLLHLANGNSVEATKLDACHELRPRRIFQICCLKSHSLAHVIEQTLGCSDQSGDDFTGPRSPEKKIAGMVLSPAQIKKTPWPVLFQDTARRLNLAFTQSTDLAKSCSGSLEKASVTDKQRCIHAYYAEFVCRCRKFNKRRSLTASATIMQPPLVKSTK